MNKQHSRKTQSPKKSKSKAQNISLKLRASKKPKIKSYQLRARRRNSLALFNIRSFMKHKGPILPRRIKKNLELLEKQGKIEKPEKDQLLGESMSWGFSGKDSNRKELYTGYKGKSKFMLEKSTSVGNVDLLSEFSPVFTENDNTQRKTVKVKKKPTTKAFNKSKEPTRGTHSRKIIKAWRNLYKKDLKKIRFPKPQNLNEK